MSSIAKQENGRWRARYRDLNGRSRSQTFDRKQDAQDFLDDASSDMRRGEWIDPVARRGTFDAWADRWWATTAKLRPTSRRTYWVLLEGHVRPYFASRKLVEISYGDVEAFIAESLAGGLSPKYVRQLVSVVSMVMRCAVKDNARRDNPAADHSIPTRRRKMRQGDVLDMTQAHRLIENVRDPYKPAVWLLLLAGLRPAELCGLRVSGADLVRRPGPRRRDTVLPVQKFDESGHKPARERAARRPRQATGPSDSPSGCAASWRRMLAARAERRGTPIDQSEYLFQTRYRPTPQPRPVPASSVVRPALAAAGLPETIRTYDLRHSPRLAPDRPGSQRPGRRPADGPHRPLGDAQGVRHLFEGVQEQLTEQLDDLRQETADQPPRAEV